MLALGWTRVPRDDELQWQARGHAGDLRRQRVGHHVVPRPGHPLQVAIKETFAELTGDTVEMVAVDGCGAPLLSTTLVGLAPAFRRLRSRPTGRSTGWPTRSGASRVHLGHDPRRGHAAGRRAGRDREGRGRVLLRPRAARRPGRRPQDRRRRAAGPAGADGGGPERWASPRSQASTRGGAGDRSVRRPRRREAGGRHSSIVECFQLAPRDWLKPKSGRGSVQQVTSAQLASANNS